MTAANAAAIAKMIAFAARDSTRQNAKELGQAMAREDGVRTLEALVQRRAAGAVRVAGAPGAAGAAHAAGAAGAAGAEESKRPW